jgi:hypothetical protein
MDTTTLSDATSAAAAALADLADDAAHAAVHVAEDLLDGATAIGVPGVAVTVAKAIWRRGPWAVAATLMIGGLFWWRHRCRDDRAGDTTSAGTPTSVCPASEPEGRHVHAV